MPTADGWMQRISEMLSRMHELAVESNDATKGDADRTNIEADFSALKSEINRIVDSAAKFNGKGLLNGSVGGVTQVGADSGQTTSLNISNLSTVVDSIGGVATASAANAVITETVQTQTDAVATTRASVGGLQSRFENTRSGLLNYEDNIRSAESKIRDVDATR
jgi:flagellin